MPVSPIPRRADLDWIRVGAFMLLILYHVGMYYVPWDWHLKSPETHPWLQPFMVLTNPWRITLLFVVSGAASRALLSRSSPMVFGSSRLIRLLPPILFGMLVVVPPQTWLQVADARGGGLTPFGEFYPAYLIGALAVDGLSTPTWNHLWFVVYLLSYSLGLTLVLGAIPRLFGTLTDLADRLPASLTVYAMPVAWFSLVRLGVQPGHPETYAWVGDWTVHLEGIAAFVFGYVMMGSQRINDALERCRRAALAVAVVACVVYVAALSGWISGRLAPAWAEGTMRAVYGLDQWMWVCAILGFGRKWLRHRDGPVLRYLSEAVFPLYILHQTLILAIAWALRPIGLPDAIEASLITLGAFVFSFGLFEGVRRVSGLRPLLGLGPIRRKAALAA